MRLTRQLVGLLIIFGLAMTPAAPVDAADEAVCYAAADSQDRLVSSWRTGGGFDDKGAFGVGGIEAITFNLDNSILYGADGGTLGSIDINTGAFTAIGPAGTANGPLGPEVISSLDGLAFDPVTGFLFGTERIGGTDDLLVRLDPLTGAVVAGHFGGDDYVVILASPITGFPDIDDITVDPTDGQMYGISNDGGVGDHLIKIDKTDGSVIDVGAFLGTDDMEGLSVSPDGNIFGTTGTGGGNSLWDIDKITGFATLVFAYPGGYSDIEGVSCLRSNVMTGTVFVDTSGEGTLNPGELGLAGVTVRLYSDPNGNGLPDDGLPALQTVVSPASGFYEFFVDSFGDYVIEVDATTLPSGWSLTGPSLHTASFADFGNVDQGNDFGAIGSAVDLTVTKTADLASACPGDIVTYTMTVTNTSTTTTQTDIVVNDALPAGMTYVPQSTAATGRTNVPVGNFRDDFSSRVYSRNDGTLNWTGNWIESFDDGSPTGGDIQILTSGSPSYLRIQDDIRAIRRQANLDPTAYASATLTLAYRRASDFDDPDEYVDLRVWDGSAWNLLDTYGGTGVDPDWIHATYDITPYMATNTEVGFITSAGMGNNDDFLVDYVDIIVSNPGFGTKDNIPGGANGDLLDGDAPGLVVAGDSYFISPSESMTVTFQATVDNPFYGTSPLTNAVTATSTEGGFDLDSADTTITLATIGNLVWHDFHQNGIQEASEPGIADVPITAYGPGPDGNLGTVDDVYVSSTFTDANGIYSFPNLGPGEYRAQVNAAWLAASGYPTQTHPTPDTKDYYDLDGADLSVLACGGSELGADFGYWDDVTVPVTLSSFKATSGRSTTVFEWTTATQAGTVGFNLYAVSGKAKRRINSQLIPAHTPDSTVPQRYQFESAVVDGDHFVIEDVDIFGRREQYGPFSRGDRHGLDPRDAPEKPVDWPAIRSAHFERADERRRARRAISSEHGFETVKRGLSTKWRDGGERRAPSAGIARLLVESDGVYRVTHDDLLDAGIDLTGIDAERFTLTVGGEPVAIRVGGGPVFGPGSLIEWVAFGVDSLYTAVNAYTLKLGPRNSPRVAVDWRPPDHTVTPAEFYWQTNRAERDLKYSFAAPNGDPWYDTAILAFTEPKTEIFTVNVEELVEGVDDVVLTVEMWGTTNWPVTPDHHVEVEFNGVPVADDVFDGLVNHPLETVLPAGVLEQGINTLTLTLPGDTGVAYDMVTFDSFSVTYPRRFIALFDRLDFEAAAEAFRVIGFSSGNLLVYRVTDDQVTLLAGRETAPHENRYRVDFRGSPETARYFIVPHTKVSKPIIERTPDGSDLFTGRADYLVIAHPDFLTGIEPLVAAREDEGWRVKVVDVEAIYAEFSHGVVDPEGIRSYIRYAADRLETDMVLLVGGDTYDYHDNLGLGSISFIPSFYEQTDEIVRFAPVDPLFTDLDGDGMPDLPIGRLPVRTTEELEAVIDKTLDYAAKHYPSTGIFAADALDASGESFATISNSLISRLPGDWSVSTAYLDEMTVDDARARLRDGINQGVALTSYFGHSGPSVWSFDNLFHVTDAEKLENHRMPTIVTQWGCWNTYYVEPTNNTMGHALLLSGDRGAAAVFGASTLTETASDQALGDRFLPLLTQPGMTIGEALQNAKYELALDHPEMLDVILGWTLLGDPALVVEPE